jgi:3,4-dihydroxy 2-butanone 4-phosphate synthase/GTP cyclohydrolase II
MPFATVPEVLDDIRAGRMVILTDDEKRENEGDLVIAAEHVTPESVTFMLTVARGYMCLSMTEADCDRLELTPQAAVNTTVRGTAFTVSIDGHPKHGFTTGVSAKERARCIRMAIDPQYRVDDFVRPGHINPLRSRDGGVLVRTGQTEGSVDLCRLAGLYPAAAIIEIMRDDGEMARLPDLEKLAARHGLKMCSVAQLIEHRLARESLVKRLEPVSGTALRSRLGEYRLFAFESLVDPMPHIALCVGDVGALGASIDEPTLVRVHRRDVLGDIFLDLDSSPEGATGETLHASMRAIQQAGRGVVVYLRPGGVDTVDARLTQRLSAVRTKRREDADDPNLTAPGNIVPSAVREIGVGSQILRDLGLSKLRLLTNHNTDWPGLEAYGLEVVERVPIVR